MKSIIAYTISFVLVFLTSITGQYFTSKNLKSDWYKCIKPSITPPGFVFPIVWTILYILIGISIARVLLYENNPMIMLLFITNLMLNISWCYSYFYKMSPIIALPQLIFIILTTFAIIYITKDKIIQYLLIPYLLWLLFATILNIMSINTKCNNIGGKLENS